MFLKPHILFVDDETNLLNGLRRGLRLKRDVWNMSFASSGEAALEIITNERVDLIISDMRMPQMDGAELLERVREISPDTVRFILSGYAKQETVLKVVGPAHQYLAKPCDFDNLIERIEQVVELRNLLNDHLNIRKTLSGVKTIPSMAHIYHKFKQAINEEHVDKKNLIKTIELDIGLKSQFFKVCNSAFFNLPNGTPNLETSVQMLGVDVVRAMGELDGFFQPFEGDEKVAKILEQLCLNSLKISIIGRKIAEEVELDEGLHDHVGVACALSHIGTFVIALKWPDHFMQVRELANLKEMPIDAYERELIGMDHAMIGGYLLGLWGYPKLVWEAVAFHHRPELCSSKEPAILAILHLAQNIARSMNLYPKIEDQDEIYLNYNFLAGQNFQEGNNKWQEILHRKF